MPKMSQMLKILEATYGSLDGDPAQNRLGTCAGRRDFLKPG